jgi:putative endonuclease
LRVDAACVRGGWIYIMTNRPNGTLYVGVTNDIVRRAFEHQTGAVPGFTRRYGLRRLVYSERHEEIITAVRREKNIKDLPRAWKIRLIRGQNLDWEDLYDAFVE